MSEKTILTTDMLKRIVTECMAEALRTDNRTAYTVFEALHRNADLVTQMDEIVFPTSDPTSYDCYKTERCNMSEKTILYVEDLIKCVTRMRGYHDTGPRDEVLLGMLWALVPAKDAVPEPKFEEGNWVIISKDGIIGTCPWRVGNRSWYGDKPPTRRLWPQIEGNPRIDRYESDLLPIPPRPEKTEPWYDLTGEVRVPTDQDEWIGGLDEAFHTIGTAALAGSRWDRRRWIAKTNNKCTECGQELPKKCERSTT